jgi:hypothetical protein
LDIAVAVALAVIIQTKIAIESLFFYEFGAKNVRFEHLEPIGGPSDFGNVGKNARRSDTAVAAQL